MVDQLFAALGRKQVALDNLNVEYDRLLDLMRQVVSGEIARERVVIDCAGRSWSLAPGPKE